MAFLSYLRSFVGMMKVEQTTTGPYPKVSISGINTENLKKDLINIFKTSKVYSSIFDEINARELSFPAFFALEVEKIMQMVIASSQRLNVSRNTANTIIEGLKESTWISKIHRKDYPTRLDQSKLKLFRYKPLPYQQAFLDMFDRVTYQYSLNGVLLDAVMGSGKTITSLYIAECSGVDIKVIVSPANAVDNVWTKTIKNDINRDIKYWTTKMNQPYNGEEYIVCHYEALKKVIPLVQSLYGKKFCLIVDECHNFAESKSLQSQYLIELHKAMNTTFVIPQSGTTFKAIGAEIITMLYLLDPTFTEEVAKRFRRMYGASATESLELLKYRMGLITHKVTKEDVGLPEPIIKNFKVTSPLAMNYSLTKVKQEMKDFVQERVKYYKSRESTDTSSYNSCINSYKSQIRSHDEQKKFDEYVKAVKIIRDRGARDCTEEIVLSNAFERSYILPKLNKEMQNLFKEVKTIYKYVALKINGECLGRVLAARRKECAQEIARNINYQTFIESTTKKTLVYTVYVDTLKTAKQTLEDQDYRPLVVYGETNKDIVKIINTFDADKAYNPLVATFKSLSTAVPMTMADVMVMIDVPFRDYVFQQSIARINRLGANTQTYVYIAELDTGKEPSLSSRTIDILAWSQSQIEAITGVQSPFKLTDEQMALESFNQNSPLPIFDSSLEEYYLRNVE